jgi:hypothetical protein
MSQRSSTRLETPLRRSFGARVWGAVVAVWAVVAGVAPHVLHHAGPLAGAALLGGLAGKVIFFAFGLLLTVPMLRRLHQRNGTLRAPALAVLAFAAVFTFLEGRCRAARHRHRERTDTDAAACDPRLRPRSAPRGQVT